MHEGNMRALQRWRGRSHARGQHAGTTTMARPSTCMRATRGYNNDGEADHMHEGNMRVLQHDGEADHMHEGNMRVQQRTLIA